MKINVKDNWNVIDILTKKGYSSSNVDAAIEAMKQRFISYAILVYKEILKKDVPNQMTICLGWHGGKDKPASAFIPGKNTARFKVYSWFVERLIENPFDRDCAMNILRLIIRSTDEPMLEQIKHTIDQADDSMGGIVPISDSNVALINTLRMFSCLRSESIERLGEILSTKPSFGILVLDHLAPFRQLLEEAMTTAIQWAEHPCEFHSKAIAIYDPDHLTHLVAPCLLMKILEKRGDINNAVVERFYEGFLTDNYLTPEETSKVMQAALRLSLADFVKGLLQLGEKNVPVKAILNFFSCLQSNSNKDKLTAFTPLLDEPRSIETFDYVVQQIIGNDALLKDFEPRYHDLRRHWPNSFDYPLLKEKLEALHDVMTKDKETPACLIAKQALAYYFAETKAIDDRVVGFGHIDDLVVIDYAAHLLNLKYK